METATSETAAAVEDARPANHWKEDEMDKPGGMTKTRALEAARELFGERGDVCALGKARFVGVQRSRHEFDWRGWGGSWEEALKVARGDREERKAKSAVLKEKFSRIPARIDGDRLIREWHGKTYEVRVLPGDGGFEFAGVVHNSLRKIAKIITGATSISGRKFFGVDQKGGAS